MIVLRTKGNHKQGMGDITGSIAIAEALDARGAEFSFVVDNDKEAVDAISARGYSIEAFDSWADEESWWKSKADKIDLALFNQLNSSAEKVGRIKELCGCFIATVDDVGKAAEIADIRFNPLYYFPDSKTSPEYIPLRKEFQEMHKRPKVYKNQVEKFLITLGGSDTYGFTPKVLDFLAPVSGSFPETSLITGSAFKHSSELEEALKNWRGKINLLSGLSASEMAEIIYSSDMAVTAGGMTLFEMACAGTPVVIVSNEPFELETADEMQKRGFGLHVGFGADLTQELLLEKIDSLLTDKETREQHGKRGRELVNGKGAEKIAEDLLARIG